MIAIAGNIPIKILLTVWRFAKVGHLKNIELSFPYLEIKKSSASPIYAYSFVFVLSN
jgi:hypothetical protein